MLKVKKAVTKAVTKAMKTWEDKLADTELVLELVTKIMASDRPVKWKNQHGASAPVAATAEKPEKLAKPAQTLRGHHARKFRRPGNWKNQFGDC